MGQHPFLMETLDKTETRIRRNFLGVTSPRRTPHTAVKRGELSPRVRGEQGSRFPTPSTCHRKL